MTPPRPARRDDRWDGRLAILTGVARRGQVGEAVDALLHALGSSSCEFLRNGNWYDAATAERHLARKFEAIDPAFASIETVYGIGYRFVIQG